ncbi:MAG: tetratricopeptide repeat protein [Chitinophagaceae bacterium]|jgi:Ca-activated chloride channel homolog|nr:tetratricopeptide repeat protein [Chitinophagaceae bacterium]
MKISFTILFSLIVCIAFAQTGEVVKGNKHYKEGDFDKAEAAYQKALSKKQNPVAQYNLGNTLYKKEKTADAIKSFEETIANTTEAELKAKALYNKGVLLHKDNKLNEAIEAYKQALRLTPADEEIRNNLQLALRAKKQKDPQEQKKQKQKEQKPKEDKKTPPPQPKPQQSKLTKKQAEQYLKALEQKEKQLQEKMRKKTGVPSQPEKDW